jgi:hypothetical protein
LLYHPDIKGERVASCRQDLPCILLSPWNAVPFHDLSSTVAPVQGEIYAPNTKTREIKPGTD